MKKTLILIFLIFLISCSGTMLEYGGSLDVRESQSPQHRLFSTANPRTLSEAYPDFSDNPSTGLIIKHGNAPVNLKIYDSDNNFIEEVSIPGASKYGPQVIMKEFPPGRYKVEVFPYYYKSYFSLSSWKTNRQLVELRRYHRGVIVPEDSSRVLYKGKYYGWKLEIRDNIPSRHWQR